MMRHNRDEVGIPRYAISSHSNCNHYNIKTNNNNHYYFKNYAIAAMAVVVSNQYFYSIANQNGWQGTRTRSIRSAFASRSSLLFS
jgi:hypothetical protein